MTRLAKEGDAWLPPDYASKTSLGMGALINAVIEAATRLKSTSDATTENDFWFLWEVLINEGQAGLYNCLKVSETYVVDGFVSIVSGGNASYIFGAVYCFVIFNIVFSKIKRSLQTETRCSRIGNYFN